MPKISELTAVTTPATTDVLAIVDGGETKKVTVANLLAECVKFAATPETYTPTNGTTDRSFDANSTTLDEVADVLATLIADLQALGIIA